MTIQLQPSKESSMPNESLRERFEEKLDRSGGKARWTGSTNNIGYPKMKVDGEMVLGSHVALRLAGRKVPTGGPAGGKIVMHKDNDKLNLAPSNLQVGTHKANLKQMRDEGRDRPRGVHQEPDVKVEKTASTDIDILKYAFQGEATSDGPGVAVLLPAAAVAGSGAWLADRVGDKVAFKLQGHTKHQGIPIAIENRKGSVRKGVDKDGKPWRTVMKMPYGYIKGSKGADGEEIDCYVGPDKDAPNAYVVHQRKADGTGYDEDKVLLGMKDKEEAKKKYLQHYNSDKFLGPVKEVPVERLKEMLSEGKKLEKISRLCGRLFRRG